MVCWWDRSFSSVRLTCRQQISKGKWAMMTLLDVLDCSFSDSLMQRFSAPKFKIKGGCGQLAKANIYKIHVHQINHITKSLEAYFMQVLLTVSGYTKKHLQQAFLTENSSLFLFCCCENTTLCHIWLLSPVCWPWASCPQCSACGSHPQSTTCFPFCCSPYTSTFSSSTELPLHIKA